MVERKNTPKKKSSNSKKQTRPRKIIKKTKPTTTKATSSKKRVTSKLNTLPGGEVITKPAGVFDRYLAKGIDLIILSFVSFILSYLSVVLAFLVATAYALFIDAYPKLSLGKMAINLRVVDQKTSKLINLRQSAIRNSPFALMVAFSIIPVLGWILMMVITIPVMILEAYLLYNLETHERLGDIIAGTKVVEVDLPRNKS